MFNPDVIPTLPQAIPSLRREDMLLVELHQHAMLVYDLETLEVLLANKAAIARFGYTRDELLTLTIAALCHEDDHARLMENVAEVDEGIDHAGLWRIRRKDRSVIDVEITSLAIHFEGRPAELVLIVDVTTMVQAERSARENEQALRTLLSSIDDLIFVFDRDGCYRKVYTAATERLLAGAPDLIGKHYEDFLPPEVSAQMRSAFEQIAGGASWADFDYCLDIQGERWWSARVTPYRDHAELSYITVCREVTAAKRGEAELRAHDALLEVVAQHSLALLEAQDGQVALYALFKAVGEALGVDRVYLFDASPREAGTGEIYSSQLAEWVASGVSAELDNPALQKIPMVAAGFGRWLEQLERGEVAQSLVREMTASEQALLEPQGIVSLMLLPILIDGQLNAMLGFDDCHGERVWGAREVAVLMLAANAVGQFMARQRAEAQRASLETQLRQSQKMEAFGQLASGVAHDFNNLITIIHMNVSMLRGEDLGPEDYPDTLRAIEAATERAANLTRQLLTFSRAQAVRIRPVNLGDLVLNTLQLLRRLLGETIQIESQLMPHSASVMADEDMLSQVLINLAVNARDAMPHGGKLSVRLGAAPVEALSRSPYGRLTGAVRLSMQDTGEGIAPEHLEHIFEPFFTTKEPGKGTGLGLATVFSIMAQHKGWIEVESARGAGTTFHLYLPTLATTRSATPVSGERAPQAGGQGRILLVEDEPALREMARRFLVRRGYEVIEAGSGDEALRRFEEAGGADALFTDMVLPGGMSGAECAAALLKLRPELPVIYTSGYNTELLPAGLHLEQGVNFLQKPYNSQDLQQIFRLRLQIRAGDS